MHERLPESVSESARVIEHNSHEFEVRRLVMLSMISPRSLRQYLQPDDETVKKVNLIQLDMDMDGVTSTNQTSTKSSKKVTAQHLRRFVLRTSPSP